METTLVHPWYSDPDIPPETVRAMRVALKSVEQMFSSDDPPEWVIFLEIMGIWQRFRMRVVLHEYATIDYEPWIGSPPITWLLSLSDYHDIMAALTGATPESICSVHTDCLDGTPCGVTVIHGSPRWLAYAEVNLAICPGDERAIVARLARHLVRITQQAADSAYPSG
jgi:hypothetical protein